MDGMTNGRDGHLDLLRLDAARAGEGAPAEVGHVAACPRCRAELAALEEAALALRDAAAPPAVAVPERVDRAVMEAYRRGTARPGLLPFAPARAWRAAAGMAAAAALALSLSLPLLRETARESSREPQPVAGPAPAPPVAAPDGDLNADGRTDILDAFLLARSLRGEAGPHVAWDGNADGRTDGADVAELARRAVTL